MFKAFYAGGELLGLPIAALVLFTFTFTAVVLRVLLARRAREVAEADAQLARLPLDDDEDVVTQPPLSHGLAFGGQDG